MLRGNAVLKSMAGMVKKSASWSRIAQTLNIPERVCLASSLAVALLDGLFDHPAGKLPILLHTTVRILQQLMILERQALDDHRAVLERDDAPASRQIGCSHPHVCIRESFHVVQLSVDR